MSTESKKTKAALELEIDRLRSEIQKRKFLLDGFVNQLYKIESKDYIEKHGIKLEDVYLQKEHRENNMMGLKLHLSSMGFKVRKWCEFKTPLFRNKGVIFRTSDLINGRFKPTPARVEDLEGQK